MATRGHRMMRRSRCRSIRSAGAVGYARAAATAGPGGLQILRPKLPRPMPPYCSSRQWGGMITVRQPTLPQKIRRSPGGTAAVGVALGAAAVGRRGTDAAFRPGSHQARELLPRPTPPYWTSRQWAGMVTVRHPVDGQTISERPPAVACPCACDWEQVNTSATTPRTASRTKGPPRSHIVCPP